MRVRPNTFKRDVRWRQRRSLLAGLVVGVLATASLMAWLSPGPDAVGESAAPGAVAMTLPAASPAPPKPVRSAPPQDDPWAGPILYRSADSGPMDLILVEKAKQKLHLYRYDGDYHRVKTYPCATGEKPGPKRQEKDERTPVGIYFNTKSYRDNKITVFGDRAFELNYPDPFDRIAGNGGHGIYIHGSNRKVTPNSTNGCVAMDNADLADLDARVRFEQTPVIIGERLPYRFAPPRRRLDALLPFLQKAMVPETHAGKPVDLKGLTLLGYPERMVALGRLTIGKTEPVQGVSRLYLADASDELLVLFRREWAVKEETASAPVVAAAKPVKPVKPVKPAKPAEPADAVRLQSLVESWRKAWQDERLADYIAHYHSAFANRGRSRDQWKAYKGALNRRYKRISVDVSNLRIKLRGDRAEAYFKQRYRSDQFRSDGFKVLVFRRENGRWKIYRENSHAQKPAGWPSS